MAAKSVSVLPVGRVEGKVVVLVVAARVVATAVQVAVAKAIRVDVSNVGTRP